MLMKIKLVSGKMGERQRFQRCAKSLEKRRLENDFGSGAKNSSRPLNVDEKTGS
jgi:hypothetical protein